MSQSVGQPWSAAALRGVTEAGYLSRLTDIAAPCPYADAGLRSAWVEGWRDADTWEDSVSVAISDHQRRKLA